MRRLVHSIMVIIQAILVLLMSGIVIVTFLQVFSRYILSRPFMWTEELTRLMGVWCVMLSASVVLAEDGHIGLDVLPERMVFFRKVVTNIVAMIFSVLLLPHAHAYMRLFNGQAGIALPIPAEIYYASISVGFLFLLFTAAYNLVQLLINSRTVKLIAQAGGKKC